MMKTFTCKIYQNNSKSIRMFPVSSVFAFFELSSVETCARQTVSLKTTRTDVDCILKQNLAYAACPSQII